MLNIQKVLEQSGIKITSEATPSGLVLSFETAATASDLDFARDLATNVFGYAIRPQSAEVASSSNFLELVDPSAHDYHDVVLASAELADANDDIEEEIEEEEEDEEEEAPEGGEDGEDVPAGGKKKKSGGGELEDRSLRVLIGPEHHKMVAKIYTGLCNNQDMAKYPAFTIDFDQFLQRYFTQPPVDHGFDGEGFGEEEASVEAVECACGTCEACMEEAFKGILVDEVATAIIGSALEVAKGKKNKGGRAGLLSMMMKHISGDRGEALVKAWESGDADTIAGVFAGIAKKLAANPPEVKA